MRQQPGLRRTFLFLQGPHGSFFPKLGGVLLDAGHRVHRINLNGGDRATWPSGDDYRGSTKAWEGYVEAYLARCKISDLVLFGDNRPPHRSAIRAAKRAGVRIHVFEEGYIRPDWITLERDGVNGHSTLPRDPSWYRNQAQFLPPVEARPALPSYATARGWAAFFYYAEVVLQTWRFPFHYSHRDRDPVWEGIAYLRRFQRRRDNERHAAADILRRRTEPYFLFPLQLSSDYQIRSHSRFGNLHAAIQEVLGDFARHAPADVNLIIKEHPLDSGLNDWRSLVSEVAAPLGIAGRVFFTEEADLLELVRESRGMVTVNSTSGTLALSAGIPVKVLGDAVYDLDGITDQRSLADFWNDPIKPDAEAWDAFYRVLASECLLHGAFLSNAGIELLVVSALERLTAEDIVRQFALA